MLTGCNPKTYPPRTLSYIYQSELFWAWMLYIKSTTFSPNTYTDSSHWLTTGASRSPIRGELKKCAFLIVTGKCGSPCSQKRREHLSVRGQYHKYFFPGIRIKFPYLKDFFVKFEVKQLQRKWYLNFFLNLPIYMKKESAKFNRGPGS